MSSFSDFYKKWKEDNGVTTETSYRNLSDSEKAQEAIQSIDRTFEEFKRTPIANKSTSEEILSPANNKLGLLFNNSKTDKKETLLTAKNKGMLEIAKKEKDNSKGILETIYEKKNSKSSTGTKYGLGNIDLTNRPIVKNGDGSISTVRSMSFQDENGKEVLIPTVVNGKVVSDDEAIQHYYQTGEYLGKFDTIEEANSYAELLHKQQESMYSNNTNKNSSMILFANQDKTNMYEEKIKQQQESSNSKKRTWFQIPKKGNVVQNILGTTGDVGLSFLEGFAFDNIENTADVLANIEATRRDLEQKKEMKLISGKNIKETPDNIRIANKEKLSDEDLEELMKKNYITEKRYENGDSLRDFVTQNTLWDLSGMNNIQDRVNEYSIAGDKTDETFKQIGYSAGMVAGGQALSGIGLNSEIGVSVAGKTLNIPTLAVIGGTAGNLNEVNSNEKDSNNIQRWLKALGGGAIEGTTEGMFGLFGVGGSSLDDIISTTAQNKLKSSIAKTFTKLGISATGEATEEFISYAGNYLLDRGIDKITGSEYSSDWNWEEVGEQMVMAFISTALSQGGVSSYKAIANQIDTNKISENAINEVQEQLGRELTKDEQKAIKSQIKGFISAENKGYSREQFQKQLNTLEQQYNEANTTEEQKVALQQIEALNNRAKQEGIELNVKNIVPIKNTTQFNENIAPFNPDSQKILQEQQIIQEKNKMPQTGNMERLNNILANNQQTVYNNTESEGGINEEQSIKSTEQNQINQRNDRRRVQGLLELYQAGETNGTASSEKLYGIKRQEEVTEQRVKETLIDYANKYNKKSLNENETKLKNIINKLGGDVVFYEYGQKNYFQGLANKDKFYIDTLGENKIENVFYHELTHFLRQQNNEIYKNEIQPIVDEIASDYDYQEAIFNYANSASENFDIRDLDGTKQSILAEEVVADQIASFYGDLEADYGLSNEIKAKLKKSMDKILLQDNIAPIGENQQTIKRIPNEITEGEVIPLGEKATEERVAKILEQSPEKVEEKDRKWAIFKANIFDKGIVFEELSRKANNRELQAKWDYTLTSTARGQNAIGLPRYEFDSETKEQKQISKSLEEIREEVGDERTDFSEYMYHQLNIDRMTLEDRFSGDTGTNYERKNPIKNKPVFANSVTAEISQKIVDKYEQSNPEFKEWAKDVYDFLDTNTKELVRNGVISEDTRQLFKEMYPHYVPISRVDNKGNAIAVPLDTGRTGINSPIKRAKGGNRDIKPLFETIADRTLQTYRASARNSLGIELKNTLQQLDEYQLDNLQQTDIDTTLDEIGDTESTDSLLQEGKGGNNPTFTIFEDGEKVTFDISKDVYDALKPMSDSSILSKNSKILNKISNLRRGVLTEYNPLFLITNSIKDAQDVLMNSQHSAKTYSKFPEAYAQIVKKGFWYNEYVQNGGEQNSYFKDGKFESDTKAPTSKKIITLPLKSISNINNMIEMAPRLAEYIASREDGRSVETSMLDASRVTTNFKAGGDIVKWANRNGATFLNASVQGAVQAVRNIQEANAKGLKGWVVLACKTAIAGLPTILLNNLLWDDDDDYAELQDYVKDSYYCIAKYGDGKFIRIPKGRTVATIQKIVSNINEYITEDKEINIDNLAKDFWEDITFAGDNLAPNNPIDNNVISPIIQAITNTSWYGEDIVPSRLQNKPKAEQYDETTDSFSIWLGEKLNQSPYKINYLIDQYSGGLGDVLLPMLTKQAESNMIEDKFTTDSTMKSKYPGEFFEKIDELEINSNSSNATDKDILKYKYMSNVSSNMSELYTKKREIQNSSVSDEMKKKQLKDVQKQINTLAKDALENVEKIKSTSTTATIGDNKYYKYNGEWKQLSEEEVEKNQNISLKTYANYKNQIYNETQSKRKSGELTEQQSLKTNDKIGILLKSNYSDEEKEAIYENYIKTNSSSDTLSTYDIMKSANINIDEYLRYEQQDFSSEKQDDGTLTGKTVSGSKKDKIINYLNSMNITGNQRLLLYASNGYSTTRNEKEQLVKYVQQLDLTKEEKLKLYDKFSGFTVYKNGEVRYK